MIITNNFKGLMMGNHGTGLGTTNIFLALKLPDNVQDNLLVAVPQGHVLSCSVWNIFLAVADGVHNTGCGWS